MVDQEVAFSHEAVTVSTTSVGITTQVGDLHGFRAVMTLETAQIRFRYDSGTPTSTTGHEMNPGDRVSLEGRGNIKNFRAIRSSTATTDATLRITLETI